LSFANTCDEKWVVAERAAQELAYIQPTPPAFRLFDAGMGDGTLSSHLLRASPSALGTENIMSFAMSFTSVRQVTASKS